MEYLKSRTYRRNVKTAVAHTAGFDKYFGKSVLILGASGLIGSFITDCFIYANQNFGSKVRIWAVGREPGRLRSRFGNQCDSFLNFIEADVTELRLEGAFDYIIHGAGYGHPKAFRETPVEVLLTNVAGTQKVLELAGQNAGCRVLYLSSGEVQEHIDHLTPRACYPIGKKAAETLCVSYRKEYGVDTVIARPCHTFGANVLATDNRAATQFIVSAARGKDIEMYSLGEQVRSFSYVADCASGLLTILAEGKEGEVYGISSGESCSVRAFADKCAAAGACRVKVRAPENIEREERSPIMGQIVDNDKLSTLGWQPAFSIDKGIEDSVRIIREMGEV